MRVLVLTHTFPRYKDDITSAFMRYFCVGLVEAGNTVHVLAPYDKQFKDSKSKFSLSNYKYIWPNKLHEMGYSRNMMADVSMKAFSYFLIPFMVFFGTISLYRLVRKLKIEVINVHWILPNGLMALFVSKLLSVPYVITLPGTDVYISRKNLIFSIVARIIANNSKAIVSNSSGLMKSFIKIGGVKKLPTKIISYPTDISQLKPSQSGVNDLRKKLNLENYVVALAVGRFVKKKGFEYLLTAMKDVVNKNNKVKLILVGDGDLKEELTKQVSDLKIKNNIIFAGYIGRKDIAKYYNLSDMMISPSIIDKNGNADGGTTVVLESMASGKPQVLTSILGMAQHVENGIGGFVIKQKDTQAITSSILKLASQSQLRKKMGQVNRRTAVRKLNPRSIGEQYSSLFESII